MDAEPRARYTYYPMHQRATRMADTDLTTPGVFDEHDEYFYDAAWRLLEERRFGESAFTGQAEEIVQRLWGLTYIDEFLGSLTDEAQLGSPDGDMTTGSVSRTYAVCDRRHDVIALLNPSGTPVEHVRYTAYGAAQVRKAADVAGTPGAVNSTDRSQVLAAAGSTYGGAGYDPDLDLNLDGLIDSADDATLVGAWGAYDAAEGRVSTVGNTIAYAGYVYDPAVDLYVVRMRWYNAQRGSWINRDPAEYIDRSSLILYVSGNPVAFVDYSGFQTTTPVRPPARHVRPSPVRPGELWPELPQWIAPRPLRPLRTRPQPGVPLHQQPSPQPRARLSNHECRDRCMDGFGIDLDFALLNFQSDVDHCLTEFKLKSGCFDDLVRCVDDARDKRNDDIDRANRTLSACNADCDRRFPIGRDTYKYRWNPRPYRGPGPVIYDPTQPRTPGR